MVGVRVRANQGKRKKLINPSPTRDPNQGKRKKADDAPGASRVRPGMSEEERMAADPNR